MRARTLMLFFFGLLIFLSSGRSASASVVFDQGPWDATLGGSVLNSRYMVMFSCSLNLNDCRIYGKTVYNIGVWIKKVGNPDDIRLQVVDTWRNYPSSDEANFSNTVPASSVSDTSYTFKWFYFHNGVVIGDDQYFMFQFAGANNTYNRTD